MPLYEYQCKKCDDVIELLVRSPADEQTAECPVCGGKSLQRLLSVTSAPSIKSGRSLPVSGGDSSCAAPRCCGGGCQM